MKIKLLPKVIVRNLVSRDKGNQESNSSLDKQFGRMRPSEIAIELHENSVMILRDYLALDRTVMSNEQSLLAYIRTALAFCAVAAAVLHLGNSGYLTLGISIICFVIALVLLVVGLVRFREFSQVLEKVKRLGLETVQETPQD